MSIASALHLMTKPPLMPREQMARSTWMSPRRSADALHWTVLPQPEGEGRWRREAIVEALAGFDAAPFTLVFDRAEGKRGGHAELRCRRVPRLARLLVDTVLRHFAEAGIVLKRKARPHVTLDYAWQEADFATPIRPIVWEVDRLLLIESVPARRLHIVHGEWPLVPRQGTLFPLRSCDRRALVAA